MTWVEITQARLSGPTMIKLYNRVAFTPLTLCGMTGRRYALSTRQNRILLLKWVNW